MGSAKLPKAWPKLFASAPPNAVVVARTGGGGTDSLVVELTDPSVTGTTEQFTARIINDEGHPSGPSQITGTNAASPPPDVGQVSLFIDNVQPQGVACSNVDLHVINPPGALTPAQVNQPGTMHTFEQECDAAHGYVTLVEPSKRRTRDTVGPEGCGPVHPAWWAMTDVAPVPRPQVVVRNTRHDAGLGHIGSGVDVGGGDGK